LFSNLGLAKGLRLDEPYLFEGCAIFGENKARRSDVDGLIARLRNCRDVAKQHSGKKILVLHQGLSDFNKFAGEMNAADIPPGFDYYALGHYHDHLERRFDMLGGLLAYPGSLDLTPSEGIKETRKGFILADLSGSEAQSHWIPLEQFRPQFSEELAYPELATEVKRIVERCLRLAAANGKKPIARLEVIGKDIDSRAIASNLVKLVDCCLYYVWHPVEEGGIASRAYDAMPADMDAELYRLSSEALGSDALAKFAIEEILPLATEKDARAALDVVWDAFKSGRLGNLK
jgi:hypothetical protein